jgi:hypothetical protein
MNRLERRRLREYTNLLVGLVVAGLIVKDAHAAEESPGPVAAEASSIPPSLEVAAYVSPSLTFGEPAFPERTSSFSRVGYFGELGIAYRSNYFVDPFFAVAYASLASGDTSVPPGPTGAGGVLEQHLTTVIVAPGITADIWRIRLRYGLGIAWLTQDFKLNGIENSSTQTPLAHQFGLGFNLLDVERFRLDVEARAIGIPGADIAFMTLGIVARGDLLVFGPRP